MTKTPEDLVEHLKLIDSQHVAVLTRILHLMRNPGPEVEPETWTPDEKAATEKLAGFIEEALETGGLPGALAREVLIQHFRNDLKDDDE
jgi:hypothetical protein